MKHVGTALKVLAILGALVILITTPAKEVQWLCADVIVGFVGTLVP